MKSAYNLEFLTNYFVQKEAKTWFKSEIINSQEFENIKTEFPIVFYSPSIIIRIMLFIAFMIGASGISSVLSMAFYTLNIWEYGSITIGFLLFVLLEFLIRKQNHYKSGVTEASLYSAIGFILAGIISLSDLNVHFSLIFCILIFTISAIRYLDIVSTILAITSFSGLIFYELFEAGGIFKNIIPIVFFIIFSVAYFAINKYLKNEKKWAWQQNIFVAECISLIMIYLSVNYFIVRELSVNLMNLNIPQNGDIPLAFLFYFLTIIIPSVYIYLGINKRNITFLRIGLIAFAFSVFTFKYYYSLGYPEITLTIAGLIMISTSFFLLNYLKTIRNGFTREKLISEPWENSNLKAFIISQTMGGNVTENNSNNELEFGGGKFGGGGAGSEF